MMGRAQRVGVEEKYYFKRSAPKGFYSALEFNFLKNRYQDVVSFESGPDRSGIYSDSVGIKKQTYSLNVKMGYQVKVRRFVFDFFAGLGLRYKDVRHFDRINPNDRMFIPIELNIPYFVNLEGKRWTISVPLNARVGWAF